LLEISLKGGGVWDGEAGVGVELVVRGSGVWSSADGVDEVVGRVRMESEGSGSGVDDWGGFVRMELWGEGGSQLGGESGEQVVGMERGGGGGKDGYGECEKEMFFDLIR